MHLGVARGQLTVDTAAAAIVEQLALADLETLVVRRSTALMAADERLTPSERAHAYELLVEIEKRMVARGLDLQRIRREASDTTPPVRLAPFLTLWLPQASKPLDAADKKLVGSALTEQPSRELFAPVLSANLTKEELEEIFATSWSIDLFDLCITQRTLERLFEVVRQYPNVVERAEAVLRHALPKARETLASFHSTVPAREIVAQDLLRRVLA